MRQNTYTTGKILQQYAQAILFTEKRRSTRKNEDSVERQGMMSSSFISWPENSADTAVWTKSRSGTSDHGDSCFQARPSCPYNLIS